MMPQQQVEDLRLCHCVALVATGLSNQRGHPIATQGLDWDRARDPPGALSWSGFSEPHGYDFNGTLAPHEGGSLCIAPVEPSNQVLDRLGKEGVARILITDGSHTRVVSRVREKTGARVVIHAADAAQA
jgi:hypothetical protein